MIEQKKGTTTVGIIAKDAVILAAESMATMGYLVASKEAKKVYKIDDKIAMTTAGSVGDAQQLVRILQAEIRLYKMTKGEAKVRAITNLLSNILHSNRMFPYLSVLVIGGVDSEGFHLFNVDSIGGVTEDSYTSSGSGSPLAYGVLEERYKDGMSRDEAIKLAIQAIKSAKERSLGSGGERIDVAVIDNNGVNMLSRKKIEKYL
ncbi:MAG: archaeal proteasome endopeptidase complex subunit beta [Candidatus Aenigmarchaeota archaeon]|nr:archaeal proteasome endopeptidase complex subunit beta [Candidatus Aenigmarchaeota archaeon]